MLIDGSSTHTHKPIKMSTQPNSNYALPNCSSKRTRSPPPPPSQWIATEIYCPSISEKMLIIMINERTPKLLSYSTVSVRSFLLAAGEKSFIHLVSNPGSYRILVTVCVSNVPAIRRNRTMLYCPALFDCYRVLGLRSTPRYVISISTLSQRTQWLFIK